MNSLLERAVDAHGGLDRWNQFTALEAKLSIGGAIWSSKQQPGLLTNGWNCGHYLGQRKAHLFRRGDGRRAH
jgi:hypothetical protein